MQGVTAVGLVLFVAPSFDGAKATCCDSSQSVSKASLVVNVNWVSVWHTMVGVETPKASLIKSSSALTSR